MSAVVWIESYVAKLCELWPTHSAQQVVDAFARDGLHFTRNAVIGKVQRLGLDSEGKLKPRPVATPRPVKKAERSAPRLRPPRLPRQPFTPKLVDTVITCAPIPFDQMTDSTCKYECSSQDNPADYLFCGALPVPGKPYCPAHCALVYVAPQPRKRSHFRQAA